MLGGHEDIVRYLGDSGADLAYIKKVNVYTTSHEGEAIVFLINFKNSCGRSLDEICYIF